MKKNFIIIICIFILACNAYGRPLKIGICHFDPPFVMWSDSKHLHGFDVAMMLFLCKRMNDECKFIPIERNQLIEAVASGKIDVAVSDLTITKDRSEKVLFSLPYLITTTHIIGLKKNVGKHFELSALDNKKIGITDKEYAIQIKNLHILNPNVLLFSEDDDLIKAINDGEIDFALVDAFTAAYWSVNSSERIKDFGCPKTFELTPAIAISPHNPALQEQINQALSDYRSSHEFLDNYHDNLLHF